MTTTGDPAGRTRSAGMDVRWTYSLKPDASQPVPELISDPELVDEVVRRLGADVAAWVAQVGARTSDAIAGRIGAFADDPYLRLGPESATLSAVLMLSDSGMAAPPVTEDAKRAITEYVQSGVRLNDLLSGIRMGHAGMSDAFLAACGELVPGEERAAVLRVVSARLFEHIDRFTSMAEEFYESERERLLASPSVARARVARGLVLRRAGQPELTRRERQEAEEVLGYRLDQSHIALVLESASERDGEEAATELRRVAYAIARRLHAGQYLVVTADGQVWAWLAGMADRRRLTDTDLVVPPDVLVSAGSQELGPAGFRRSHEQAQTVRQLRRQAGGSRGTGKVWLHDDVELVALLATDPDRAKAFVARHLHGLLGRSIQADELRRTLKAYLDVHASPVAVAQRLHLARNTVTARIQKAAEHLRRDLTADTMDLHAALLLVELFGDAILPE